jgi:hypothetical protein
MVSAGRRDAAVELGARTIPGPMQGRSSTAPHLLITRDCGRKRQWRQRGDLARAAGWLKERARRAQGVLRLGGVGAVGGSLGSAVRSAPTTSAQRGAGCAAGG